MIPSQYISLYAQSLYYPPDPVIIGGFNFNGYTGLNSGLNPVPAFAAAKYSANGATCSSLNRSSGIASNTGLSTNWGSDAFDPLSVDIATSTANLERFSFSIANASGKTFKMMSINGLSLYRSASGPSRVALLYNFTNSGWPTSPIIFDILVPYAPDTNGDYSIYTTNFFNSNNVLVPNGSTIYFRMVPYASVTNAGLFGIQNTTGAALLEDISIFALAI